MSRTKGTHTNLAAVKSDGKAGSQAEYNGVFHTTMSMLFQVVRLCTFLVVSVFCVLETAIRAVPDIGASIYVEMEPMASGTYLDAIVWFIVPFAFVVLMVALAEFSLLRSLWKALGDVSERLQKKLFRWYDGRAKHEHPKSGRTSRKKASAKNVEE